MQLLFLVLPPFYYTFEREKATIRKDKIPAELIAKRMTDRTLAMLKSSIGKNNLKIRENFLIKQIDSNEEKKKERLSK